ncbi:MAG TPA: LysR family transcriptional regulator [Chloroflexaceae bacterium]|nr:LysR family transcriptional regulator [Chloroflexaceae bacterium]
MDVEQLATFERIVREGSFSRAAWALGVAQPTVSARVQALERAVGGPLFRRGGRGVALTDLGLSFLPYARRALEVLEAGVAAARQAQAGQRGQVTIGVLESLSGSFLGPALAGFHAAHPQVDVLVRAGRHEQLVELLRDGVVAMALLAWPCPESLALPLEVLLALRERVLLVAAPQHPLARAPRLPADWARLARPFLVMRWWLTLPPAVARLAEGARPLLEVPMDTGRRMVLGGTGAGFFPWMQVADALGAGRLRELGPPGVGALSRDSALVRRAGGAPLAPAAAALVAVLQRRAAQLGLAI